VGRKPQVRLRRIEGFETGRQQRDLSASGGLGQKTFLSWILDKLRHNGPKPLAVDLYFGFCYFIMRFGHGRRKKAVSWQLSHLTPHKGYRRNRQFLNTSVYITHSAENC
jgi:hypothetical protein